jgi:acyl carrier protein
MEELVINLLAKELKKNPDTINLTDSLTKDLRVDSLDTVEIIMMIEQEIGLEVLVDEITNISDVQSIVTLANSLQERKKLKDNL